MIIERAICLKLEFSCLSTGSTLGVLELLFIIVFLLLFRSFCRKFAIAYAVGLDVIEVLVD